MSGKRKDLYLNNLSGPAQSAKNSSLPVMRQSKFVLGLLIPLIVLVGILAAAWTTNLSLANAHTWVQHTYMVMQQLDKIEIAMLHAESRQRAFLLTGNEEYLVNFFASRQAAEQDIAKLKRMTADNPRQQRRIDVLFPLFKQKIDFMDNLTRTYHKEGLSDAAKIVATGRGAQLMNGIERTIEACQEEEKALLQQRIQASDGNTKGTLVLLTILSIVVFAIFAGFIYFVQAYYSERERAALEQANMLDKLARSNAELTQFAYVASHDLNEPLRSVTSYLQLLSRRYKGQLDKDADEFIDFACSGAERMKQLISDLLQYSRIEHQEVAFAAVDLNQSVNVVLANLDALIKSTGAEVKVGVLPTVVGDKTQITQLLQNLLSNAIKFCRDESPLVEIKAQNADGREWIISVSDNGIGIDQKYKDKIFEVFQRLHTRKEYPGTGIGLAVCKKIVDRHGGRIWLESELDKGTTFYFSFPIRTIK